MSAPAYTRLENDERRRRLLELGTRLFTEHAYDEISMAQIAREAGISKALLYHYFPSKQDYFVATLAGGAQELRARVEPDPSLPPARALTEALDAYLSWIEDNADAYAKLFRSAAGVPEVRDLVEAVRDETAERILDGLGAAANARARIAVRGWLWFTDGACLDWIAHRDLTRGEMHGLLLGTLAGALLAAGVDLPTT
ncbi:MAG TPA: TetR/AcrR family transcriptional regulator [Solirubrobacteraceae bacterium]|nr:TetR/AcrR family transcriptional regulator [Solirubrobacteraceae bacterium]